MKKSLIGVGLVVMFLASSVVVALKSRSDLQALSSRMTGQNNGNVVQILHPLEIEAMRMRQYDGGEITVEQELGDRGGYRDLIVSYRSDGLKVYALMSRPNGAKPPGGWPVIILEHGYIAASVYRTDGEDYRNFIDTLARAGYLVLKPDYRGHGRSEGAAAGGHFTPDYAYDILNLIAAIKRYPEVNAAKIGQIGHSLGGHVALRAAVVSPDIRASVIAAGVVGSAEDLIYNWRRPGQNTPVPAFVRSARLRLIEEYGDPRQNQDFWSKVWAINHVKNITGEVQIHHGTADEVVPKLFSDRLDEAMRQANKQAEYFVYEGGDHQFSSPGVRSLFLQRILEVFDRNLK